MGSNTIKERHIIEAVSKIFRYRQTYRQLSCYFHMRIIVALPDKKKENKFVYISLCTLKLLTGSLNPPIKIE